MPAVVKNLHYNKDDSSVAMTLWFNKMKSLPMEEDEVAKAVKKKNPAENKKTCICAPTNHAGSFRCHLHRMSSSAAQKSSTCVVESIIGKNGKKFNNVGDVNCIGDNNNNGQQPTRISRFGRAASARTTTNSHHDTSPLAMASVKPKKEID
ncbi:hypothetical protein FNV43_RR22986 [Rhamnella rubrinervis]|uniref:Uncharacterized protein n=1 Tax=Rhamnella rubrinervis TaxID=2594499 RepID=A0A8K0GRM5_9ROSA|nr:hypothetical protein FNV43_RR22986 [Rhamnella rubrinervis]